MAVVPAPTAARVSDGGWPASTLVAVRIEDEQIPVIMTIYKDDLTRPLQDTVVRPFVQAKGLSLEDISKLEVGEMEYRNDKVTTRESFKLAGFLRDNRVANERVQVALERDVEARHHHGRVEAG